MSRIIYVKIQKEDPFIIQIYCKRGVKLIKPFLPHQVKVEIRMVLN